MTKADIVAEIAVETGVERNDVQKTVESFMTSIKSALAKDENVYLRGFGSFTIKTRASKTGRDPLYVRPLCRSQEPSENRRLLDLQGTRLRSRPNW